MEYPVSLLILESLAVIGCVTDHRIVKLPSLRGGPVRLSVLVSAFALGVLY